MNRQALLKIAGALLLAGQWSFAGASALSDAAAALQPGQWVQLSTQNFNSALLDDGASFDVFYYSEDMTWDPVTRQLLFVGGGHDSDAEFLRYSEATNTWSRSKPTGGFWHANFSHAYDHNAIIPSLGKFFFRQPAYDPSDRIEIFDIPTQTWTRSATMPDRPGCCGGLEYFPELNGLVLANGDAGLLLYNVGSNSWQTLSSASWGDYHNFAEYSPVHKTLIFGGGESSGTTAMFRLNADRSITRLNNAPQHVGETYSIITTDPNSGNHLVFFNNSFYEFNPATDTWRLQSGDAPWSGGVFGTVATPISTYGVILFAHYGGSSDARVYLYRHSPGSGTTVPTVTLSANPVSVASGAMTTLAWSSTDATSCTASGGWSGTRATSGSETSAALTTNTTFTLACSNGQGGSTSRSVTVTVASSTPPPTANFSASPGSVAVGGSSTLSWTTTDAASCSGSGAWSGSKSVPNGSQSVGPLSAAATYMLSCTGAGGTTQRSVTVNMLAAPTVAFGANPTTVAAGARSTLTWSSQNATGCTASGAWAGGKAASGSEQSPIINASSTYNLTCTGAGGSTGRSVTVNVSTNPPPPPMPTASLSASPTTVSVNGSAMLSWSSTDAASCTASGAWSGAKPTSGSESTAALSNTATYSLTCTGAGGTTNPQSVTVTVNPGGGTGGGGATTDSSGGGSVDLLLLALGALLLAARFVRGHASFMALPRSFAAALATLVTMTAAFSAQAADITTVTVVSTSGSAQSDVPVTFGHVFKPGDVPANAVIGVRQGSTVIPLQVDKKATHADGSLRHAVLSLIVPSMGANASQVLTLNNTGTAPSGGPITAASLLGTSFDTTIDLDIGGVAYSASARELLAGSPATWLSGPLATEFLLSGPVKTAAGVPHPHLQARFHVRAYQGLQAVRVEAVLENNWAFEAGPRNYTYNLTVNVAGRGAVYTQSSVNHYRQSRWRRVVWWGAVPSFTVKHDSAYLMATRAVPTYDTRVQVSSTALNGWVSGLGTNPGVMSIGALEANMPSPGGRFEIAPLPAFQAGYILSQDDRARRVTIGYGEQAGAWPMHYRDKVTDQPISIDTYPNATIIGESGIFGNFPACGGTCSTNLLPEASHHPSLVYLPYLITGDYYLMEELAFWGNWVLFYGEAGRHGGSQGLLVWDQVRGQAWMLRTLTEAAYATPDAHPLKNYLKQKLQNNITYFRNNWVDSNPLGYITNTGAAAWLGLDDWIATWMDDFLTYAFGRMVALGFTEAQPVLAWKAKFPVGRLTDPGMCWVLASSYWPYVKGDRYVGGSAAFVTNWTDWRRNVIFGWNNDAFRGTNDIGGREQELFNAQCGSSQMSSILGIGAGQMIGWDGAEAYPANLQAAAAVAVEAGVANAQQAWTVLTSRGGYPLTDYGDAPQWAVWPATATASLPAVQISANPTAVASGQTSTLTWSATNATSCTASGGWAGTKALSGSETTAAITTATTYTLTCSNASGSSSAAATVTIQTASAPTLTLTANPTSVASGGSSTLTWSSTNATACTASGGWSGAKATSGNQTITNITATATYTLQCTGAGGSIQRSATVSVQATPPAPTLTLAANPTSVSSGGSSTLTWSSTNATSCTASGGWTGAKATSGSQTFTNLTASVTYGLQCMGAGVSSPLRNATVTVNGTPPPPPAPTVTLNANPTSVAVSGTTTLDWTSTNATSCTASGGGWGGTKQTQGSEQSPAISNTTQFTLTCNGAGGSASDSADVTVTPGGGGGGGGDNGSGGGGSLSWLSVGFLALAAAWRRRNLRLFSRSAAFFAVPRFAIFRSAAAVSLTAAALVLAGCGEGDDSSSMPLPTLTLSANPMSVASGGSTQLTWASTDATSCAGSGDWSGTVAPSGTTTISNITTNKTFSAQCTGPGGTSATQSVTVAVNAPPVPTATLSANPTTVNSGGSTQLTWSSTNATACTASGGWSGSKNASGNQTINNLTNTTMFSLQCSGTGGSSPMQNVTVTVNGAPPPPAPTATISANPTTVASGGSSQLTWSSTNATSCTASGAWSGSRATSGTQNLTNLTATATYSLQCTGAGGTTPLRSATITVTSAPAPTLSLSANPATINSGGQSVLTWNSSNATACTASGGWSGAKSVNGNETVGPLTQTTTYTLTCTGGGGSVNRNATVTVNGGSASLQGSVDSSYVDRFGDNRIYVFAGSATPDDFDGDAGDPVTTVAVTQDANACTFNYGGGNLAAGTYTIAFTQDAAADVPGQDNTLVFVGTRQVTVGASGVTSDFRPSGIITVGPGRQHATLSAAQQVATDGAVIEIDAGTYTDDVTVWRQNRVTIRGVGGGRAHIVGNRVIPFDGTDRNNGMALMVIRGTGISVENIEFSNAKVTDLNGAGIRNQGRDLSVCNGFFHDNQDGYLGEALGTLLFEYSEFARNGLDDPGFNHNLYVDGGDRLIFRHNYTHHAFVGHTLKTRAAENFILYNRLMDEDTGSSSYNIDVPNGGLTFVIGNLIQQGPNTDNSSMLNYGTEGLSGGRTHELYLVNNTWVNDAGFGGFTQVQGGTSLVRVINNLFVGQGSIPSGTLTTNLLTNAPGLVSEAGFDYHLTSTSPARDAGTAPGSARGQDLTPVYQYVHKAQREARPTDARIDIGAYEYTP